MRCFYQISIPRLVLYSTIGVWINRGNAVEFSLGVNKLITTVKPRLQGHGLISDKRAWPNKVATTTIFSFGRNGSVPL